MAFRTNRPVRTRSCPCTGERASERSFSIEKTATLLAEFDKNAKAGRAAIARLSDAALDEPWHFKRAGVTLRTYSRYAALRSTVLSHLVHHRAQLGLYLRLVGEKVPEMYGPTADSPRPQ